jgi:hypothetical protein
VADNLEQDGEKEFLDRLRASRPDTSMPAGCDERLHARLVGQIQAQELQPALKPRHQPMRTWLWRAASMVAAAIVMAVGAWLLLGRVSTASASFAEMIRRVCQAKTVSYDYTVRVPGGQDVKYSVSLGHAGQRRIVLPDRVQIFDYIQHRALALYPATKKAKLREWFLPSGDPVENLKEVGDSAGKFVTKEVMDGRDTVVYRVSTPQQVLQVWVDPREELPVRMEIRGSAQDGPETITILDNFCWNCPIPESSFSLSLPPDYSFDQSRDYKTEESLVHLLKTCADTSAGVFPATIGQGDVLVLLTQGCKSREVALGDEVIQTTEASQQEKENLRVCFGGLAFIEQIKANGTWRYCGQGSRLGDAAAVICWWQPSGTQNYRVVYGDLQVKDVTKRSLPTRLVEPSASQPTEQIRGKTQAPGLRN